MAQTIGCDGCEQAPAVLLVTNIGNGQVMGFCFPCSGVWAGGHAAVVAKVMDEVAADQEDGAATEGELTSGAESAPDVTSHEETGEGGDSDGALRGADSEFAGVHPSGVGGSGLGDEGGDPAGQGEAGPAGGDQPGPGGRYGTDEVELTAGT